MGDGAQEGVQLLGHTVPQHSQAVLHRAVPMGRAEHRRGHTVKASHGGHWVEREGRYDMRMAMAMAVCVCACVLETGQLCERGRLSVCLCVFRVHICMEVWIEGVMLLDVHVYVHVYVCVRVSGV